MTEKLLHSSYSCLCSPFCTSSSCRRGFPVPTAVGKQSSGLAGTLGLPINTLTIGLAHHFLPSGRKIIPNRQREQEGLQKPRNNKHRPRAPALPPHPQPQTQRKQKRPRHLYQHRQNAQTLDLAHLPGEVDLRQVLHHGERARAGAEDVGPGLGDVVGEGEDDDEGGDADCEEGEEHAYAYYYCVAAFRGWGVGEGGGGGGEVDVVGGEEDEEEEDAEQ